MKLETNNTKLRVRSFLYWGIVIALAIGIAVDIFLIKKSVTVRITAGKYNEINEVLQLIQTYYFDDVSTQELKDEAIRGMLQNLDPHSSYMTREEAEQARSVMMGGFEGVGIQFNILNDTLLVIAVTAGGPSEKVGVMAGDRIINVDGETIAGVNSSNTDIIKKLRGKKGTKVHIEILRQGHEKLVSFDIIRDKIAVHSVNIAYEIAHQTGYIHIDNFTLTTKDEFHDALKTLIDKGMTKLILDLRGNSGGHLDAAIAVCNQLLPKDKLIVYTYGKSVGKQKYFSNSSGLFNRKVRNW